MKTIYNIVYATDDTFAPVLGTSLLSLLRNNKEAEKINFFILDSGISKENKFRIEKICDNFVNASLNWIKIESISKKIGIDVKNDRGSFSQYSRLFIGDVLDNSVERVLYLDCDTLILSSLKDLWNIDLEGNIIAALKDAFSKYYRKNINLVNDDLMFNSGVMLIDLKAWRDNKIKEKVISFIRQCHGKVQQGDQGVLNSVLSNKTYALDPRYNLVSIFYDLNYREIKLYRSPVNFYSERVIEDAKKNPIILHFTSSFYSIRPWFKNSNHDYKTLWLKYYKKTPWKDRSLGLEKSKKKKIINILFNYGLKDTILFSAGFFQKYLRPLKNKIMR
ncbi:glycosyltransferase family 8 protein [Limosilactobacillus reuteri]|uniref:glycosyltransferase family 8 protein n=1 Tax=Limosilactobacillus reuteri TaxID=1598 RepID=UPI002331160C|nr:glycosyltransferase family 8 protein [Limosilactobacillus reuteri]